MGCRITLNPVLQARPVYTWHQVQKAMRDNQVVRAPERMLPNVSHLGVEEFCVSPSVRNQLRHGPGRDVHRSDAQTLLQKEQGVAAIPATQVEDPSSRGQLAYDQLHLLRWRSEHAGSSGV